MEKQVAIKTMRVVQKSISDEREYIIREMKNHVRLGEVPLKEEELTEEQGKIANE